MNTAKLKPMLGKVFRLSTFADLSRVPERLEYEVVTFCYRSAMQEIELIIQQHLVELAGHTTTLSDLPTHEGSLGRITARAMCTIEERSQLVKLVTRLGLEKSVRSIRWVGITPHKH